MRDKQQTNKQGKIGLLSHWKLEGWVSQYSTHSQSVGKTFFKASAIWIFVKEIPRFEKNEKFKSLAIICCHLELR